MVVSNPMLREIFEAEERFCEMELEVRDVVRGLEEENTRLHEENEWLRFLLERAVR